MSKPGEMVQILREDYENILEQYRLLRNKFLVAVPGMNLDKERDFYNFWKSDLNLSSIIDSYRKPAPSAEPGALREALIRCKLECCDGQCGIPDIVDAALGKEGA